MLEKSYSRMHDAGVAPFGPHRTDDNYNINTSFYCCTALESSPQMLLLDSNTTDKRALKIIRIYLHRETKQVSLKPMQTIFTLDCRRASTSPPSFEYAP